MPGVALSVAQLQNKVGGCAAGRPQGAGGAGCRRSDNEAAALVLLLLSSCSPPAPAAGPAAAHGCSLEKYAWVCANLKSVHGSPKYAWVCANSKVVHGCAQVKSQDTERRKGIPWTEEEHRCAACFACFVQSVLAVGLFSHCWCCAVIGAEWCVVCTATLLLAAASVAAPLSGMPRLRPPPPPLAAYQGPRKMAVPLHM